MLDLIVYFKGVTVFIIARLLCIVIHSYLLIVYRFMEQKLLEHRPFQPPRLKGLRARKFGLRRLRAVAFLENLHIHLLQLFPGPRRFPEKPETRSDRRIKKKTTDREMLRHLLPTHLIDHPFQDHFERHTVKRVLHILMSHEFPF